MNPTACKVLLHGDSDRDAGRVVDAVVADGHAAYYGWTANRRIAKTTTRFSIIEGK